MAVAAKTSLSPCSGPVLAQPERLWSRLAPTGSAVRLDEVPEAECVLLYTATRELLTNVVKHSGSLQADLELTRRDQSITLAIRDAAHGFDLKYVDTSNEGFGLLSIRERVHMLGGEFTVNTGPGRGVEVAVEIPIRSAIAGSERLQDSGQAGNVGTDQCPPPAVQETHQCSAG